MLFKLDIANIATIHYIIQVNVSLCEASARSRLQIRGYAELRAMLWKRKRHVPDVWWQFEVRG